MAFRLRVTRTEASRTHPASLAGRSAHAYSGQLQTLLRRHLPPAAASIFAEPTLSSDGAWVEWLSPLNGQPIPLTKLSPAERSAAEAALSQHLDAVRALADRLAGGGDATNAELLRLAAVPPKPSEVFVVNGHPVVTHWGEAAPPPVAPAASAPVPPPIPVTPPPTRRGCWLWSLLALLLLLLLLALLLFGLRSCDIKLPVLDDLFGEAKAPEVPAVEPDKPDLKAEEDELRKRIAEAEEALRHKLEECAPPKTEEPVPEIPKTETPKPQTPKEDPLPIQPPKVETPPAVTPDLPPHKPAPPVLQEPPKAEPPKAESPKVSPPQTEPQKPEPQKPEQKKAECPPPRKKYEAPEVALVLDASGSMALPADMKNGDVQSLMARAMRGDAGAIAQLNQLMKSGRTTRLDEAKSSVKTLTEQIPADVDLGLLVFGRCEGTDNYKFFSGSQRPQLLSEMRKIQPQEGTPLARGVERAGNMVDGVNVPGVIVVVTDGDDSCGGDPCAVARALHAKKPNVKINLISVDGSRTGACMAEATGGKVIVPRDGQKWDELLMQASEQAPVPASCR